MINNILICMAICLTIWLICRFISEWSWSKFSKEQHEFLYGKKDKKLVKFFCGVYEFFGAIAHISVISVAVLLMFLIFELVGL